MSDETPTIEEIEAEYQKAIADGTVTPDEIEAAVTRFRCDPRLQAMPKLEGTRATPAMLREELHAAQMAEAVALERYSRAVRYAERVKVALQLAEARERGGVRS